MERRGAGTQAKTNRGGTVGAAIVGRHHGPQHLSALGELMQRVLLRPNRVQQQMNEVDAMLRLKPSRRGLGL